jgi:AraC-like DNA-binding protein
VSVNIVCFDENQLLDENNRRLWVGHLLNRYGLKCELLGGQATICKIVDWQAGGLQVIELEVAHQALTPVLHQGASWDGSHIFVVVVWRGAISIRQSGFVSVFREGSVLVLDPLRGYTQQIDEISNLVVIRLSRAGLCTRGPHLELLDVQIGDMSSADMRAVRDFVLFFVRQGRIVSEVLKRRFAEQCAQMVYIALTGEPHAAGDSSNATIMLRAKQAIARLAGDPDLDPGRIAQEANVSTYSLGRAFRSAGQTPMRYLMSLRLNRAAQMLAEEGLQIEEIACRCGFADAPHFSKAFRKRFGMTPREFVDAHKLKAMPDDPISSLVLSRRRRRIG